MLEIDQKNLIQAKEMQANAREVLQADQERLLQIVQQAEMQKLSRKYKIAAISEQLGNLANLGKQEQESILVTIINQLNLIKEDDCQTHFTSNDISDMEPPTDNISQSSLSIRSTPFTTHANRLAVEGV